MPPNNAPASPQTTGQTVTVGSPEFTRIVSDAVEAALAKVPTPAVREVAVQAPVVIQHTSIDTTQPGPDDLTIRFNRFCTLANCGYQRGQEAGFPRQLAMSAVASGAAQLVHDPRGRRAA